MKIFNNPSPETWKDLSQRPQLELEFLESSVRNVLNRIKKSGDHALKELTLQFDKATINTVSVSSSEIEEAKRSLPEDLKDAIKTAAANIEKFHSAQARELVKIETTPGVTCWR